MVFKSRFTPNLENGEDVQFNKGEKVKYRTLKGEIKDIIIDSELMTNSNYYGYESIFLDDNERYFAISKGIIYWEGKDSISC